jgi:hypothetical protein
MGAHLRHFVISSFPGADEKEKLDRVFSAAPPWLLWFTFADYTAALLDLTLPISVRSNKARLRYLVGTAAREI